MSLQNYPNLRNFFHEPRPIPPATSLRDHDIAARFEKIFGKGGHNQTNCPFCNKNLHPPQGVGHDDQFRMWLDGASYNPFNKAITFDQWLDRFVEAFQATKYFITEGATETIHSSEVVCELPWVRVFLPLLRAEGLDALEGRINLEKHPHLKGLFPMAGVYEHNQTDTDDESLQLSPLNRQKLEESLRSESSKTPTPNLFDDYRTSAKERLQLCAFFKKQGIVGHSDCMVALYKRVADCCAAIQHPTVANSPRILITGEDGTEKEELRTAIYTLIRQAGDFVQIDDNTVAPDYLFELPPLKERGPEDIALLVDHYLRKELPKSELNEFRFPLALWCVELKEKGWPVGEGNAPCSELGQLKALIRRLAGRLVPLQTILEVDQPKSVPTEENAQTGVQANSQPRVEHQTSTAPTDDNRDKPEYVFRKDGDFFTLTFEGETVLLRNTKGMSYISFLLGNPNQSYHVSNLRDIIEGREEPKSSIYRKMAIEGLAEEGLNVLKSDTIDTALDPQAITDYKERLHELASERSKAKEEGNSVALYKIDSETEAIQQQLGADVDSTGKGRGIAPKVKKDLDEISISIKRAKEKIIEDLEPLWHHIDKYIRPSGDWSISYSPPESLIWQIA